MFNYIESSFSIFGFSIAWYAICILTGIIIAGIMGVREARRVGINSDFIYWGLIIIVPIAIVGARLWFVLFNLKDFNSFGEVLGFQNGHFNGLSGLAIQGGIIFTVIAAICYCRAKKVSIYSTFDLIAPGLLVGQACGRWGNYCNHELYGPKIQTGAYQNIVKFFTGDNMYIDGYYRHPVFFYESFLCFLGMVLMLVLRRKCKKIKAGDMICIYLMWYGAVRVLTESLRLNSGKTDPLMMGPIPVSLALSIVFIIVGLVLFVLKRFVGPKEGYIDLVKKVNDNRPDTILFDLDGTLLNTRELIDRSFIHTFERFRPEYTPTKEDLDSFFGPTLKQTFSRFTEDENELNEMISYYREFNWANHDLYVKPFSGAKDLIKKLHKKGYRLGVVSSKKTPLVKHGLELFGLLDKMDVVIGEEEVENHKPAPDGILLAKKVLGGKNVCYVGDTLNDMVAARAAGVTAIGCLYISNPEIMLDANPDYVIASLDEILKICGE